MPASLKALPQIEPIHALAAKFKCLGLDAGEELTALVRIIRQRETVRRGGNITSESRRTTVLLSGVTCWYKRVKSGRRQIFTFQYAGDFCDLHRYVLPEVGDEISIGAVTECAIGVIDHDDIERIIV